MRCSSPRALARRARSQSSPTTHLATPTLCSLWLAANGRPEHSVEGFQLLLKRYLGICS